MSLRDSSIVVLEVGAHRTLISREGAQQRAKDGLGVFDGNVKIHRSLDREAIPDSTGRCRYCDDGACRPLRVSHMTSRAVSHRSSDSWKVMRVKGNRRGRKQNFTAPIERELDPQRMASELRRLLNESPLTGIFCEKFGDPDKAVRELELKRNPKPSNVVPRLDARWQSVFIEVLDEFYSQPPRNMWGPNGVAEYMAKLRRFLFPVRDTEIKDLSRFVGKDKARALQIFLDQIEDHAAEIAAARQSAAAERDRRMNDPQRRAKFESLVREFNAHIERYRKR